MSGWLIALLALVFTVVTAFLGMLIRVVQRFVRMESNQETILKSVEKLVQDKDKVHSAMFDQMKADRQNADRRLRYIEEWFMNNHGTRGR